MRRQAGVSGSVFGALAVALGAFAAHALKDTLDAHSLALWRTAVEYQFVHALALIGVALASKDPPSLAGRFAGSAFLVGVVLFSGSLYALALGGPRALGLLAPIGGAALIAGWIALARLFLVRNE
ncbi:DUF423 domain-containing protein [Dokdonella immobilis]|uniref:DUF423 domain-containing protein n=1 Tax=Dokdonella immobilis TaxID=578942 RepID=UPI000B88EB4F|nr:DUF423 domain-containing protein [Dokdonella immobilis]